MVTSRPADQHWEIRSHQFSIYNSPAGRARDSQSASASASAAASIVQTILSNVLKD